MKTYNIADLLNNKIEYIREKELVELELSGIKIPRIQRDYAQGRKSEGIIRSKFLKAIFKHLLSTNEIMELDFVYGSIKQLDKKKYFIPLDGQQRLTTLFLLNWFVSNRELHNEDLDNVYNKLSNFSYETRPVAKQFCQQLMKFRLNGQSVSSIKNTSWFLNSFEADPTINAMITMLKDIEEMYNKNSIELFNRLETLRFYILPLDGFDLSDELYIKMNARGKVLSDFENFKADFISWMKLEHHTHEKKFHEKVNYHSQMMPLYLRIASKLDNEWSDLFWRNKIDYDACYFAFITRFILVEHITKTTISASELIENDIFKRFTNLKDGQLDFKYNGFEEFEEILNYDSIIKLEKVLDQYVENFDSIHKNLVPLWNKTNDWKLYSLDIIPRQYALYCGVIAYLGKYDYDENVFKEWIRVVWNIVIDPAIRTFASTISLIRNLIYPLSKYSYDILNGLLQKEIQNDFSKEILNNDFYQSRLYQEIEKARLVQLYPEIKVTIEDMEAHPMFKGHIAFFLNIKSAQEGLVLQQAVSKLIIDEKGKPGKPSNYHWLRAVLILNKDLTEYLMLGNDLVLNDGSFDQWNSLINNELKSGFYNFLTYKKGAGIEVIKTIIDEFKGSNDYWLTDLVKETIKVNETDSFLLYFSESMKIKQYQEEIFLFNKNIWTEGNILLSRNRNQLISEILSYDNFSIEWEWGNIKEKYFRGYRPFILFNSENVKFGVVYDLRSIYLQIDKNELKMLSKDNQQYVKNNFVKNDEDEIYFSEDYSTNEEILELITKLSIKTN